ncbi:DUF4105 domain-containing protein [bacterium SCSIO 12741]|nr:DUF4105 domain-containing protein [bacterium SCSIO 12741]
MSSEAEISLLTCGSGGDLYSIFGHTAIRVFDPQNKADVVFNYGTFSFTDDFYYEFTQGKLNYKLSIEPFANFQAGYIYENRWVDEQVLNLTPEEKQKVFDFLLENQKPENRFYLYDFFYDNCSTRPRDVFEQVLGENLDYQFPTDLPDSSFRDLTDLYLKNMRWSDAGIDLGLGLPADRTADERQKMYLPDYLMRGFDNAVVSRGNKMEPLVKKHHRIVEAKPVEEGFVWFRPLLTFIAVLLFTLMIDQIPGTTLPMRIMDFLIFTVVGIAGWLIVFLWFFTDHNTTQNNLNIIWALPFFFPLSFLFLFKRKFAWFKKFLVVVWWVELGLLISWFTLPQDLHNSYVFILVLLLWRIAAYINKYPFRNIIQA